MTTSTFSLTHAQTTDAEFRAWVQAVITGSLAVGMVQTADAGQINTATVLKPSAQSTAMGYVILRFADAMQATAPLFLKIEFGAGAGGSANPGMWLTVGKGSDGAGAITGVLLARTGLAGWTSAAVNSGPQDCYASAGAGWFALIPAASLNISAGPPSPGFFLIERSSDAAGVPSAQGLTVMTSPGSGGATVSLNATGSALYPQFTVINYASASSNQGVIPVTVPYRVNGSVLAGSTALAAGGIGPVFPWVALAPALAPWQCVSAVSYSGGDTPAGVFTATLSGASRAYLALPLNNTIQAFGVAMSPAVISSSLFSRYVGLAIRWE